jgi:hypothetical protein
MKYNVGDKVRYLNDVGGGKISKIINSNKVNIIDEDGFEIPVLTTDIVVVGRDEAYKEPVTVETPPKENTVKPVKSAEPLDEQSNPEYFDGDDYELFLAFVPKNQSNILDVYFINDSPFYCMYAVSHWTKSNSLKLLGQNTIEPEIMGYVYSIDKADLQSKQNLNIVSFLYKHKEYKYYPPEQVNIELNLMKLVKDSSYVENDYFDEKAYILKIATNNLPDLALNINPEELEKAMKQKNITKPVAETTPKPNSGIEEIDLHIEELVEDTRGLDNGQMLEIQKARFITALEFGISSKTKKMVFIHGVGNGRLKHEIRRLLDTQYVGLVRYHDASFQEYGYGATMVILGN